MKVVRGLFPSHPQPTAGPRLLLITTTFAHAEQLARLEHLAFALGREPGLLWIVVEDAAEPSAARRASRATTHSAVFLHLPCVLPLAPCIP